VYDCLLITGYGRREWTAISKKELIDAMNSGNYRVIQFFNSKGSGAWTAEHGLYLDRYEGDNRS